jgi:phage virion morphogenesis protein
MSGLSIQVEGSDAIQRKLSAIGKAFDTKEILDQSAALLLHNIMDRFLRAITADGEPFAALSEPYATRKQAKYGGGGILFASGKLFRSLQVYQTGDDSRALGTDVPYAVFHQFGSINLPQREFLAFGEEDKSTVQDFLVKRLMDAIDA